MIKKDNIKYLLAYTTSFIIILLAWCSPFIWGGYLPLIDGDALTQHYPALVYIGEYIREFVRSMLAGAPALPMYDFSIGMGDDIMAPLKIHSANADIGNLLFAIFPASHSLPVYTALIIFRLYAAGLTFSYFGFSVLKTNKRFVLIGALMYTFCNWTFLYAFRHISFLLALIYLPLIIAGFDAVLKNKKPYLFIVSVFLMALASFYFMYMQTIFLIFYALIRVHMLYKGNYIKCLIVYGLKSVGFFIVGVMMAALTFIPLITAHLTSGREMHVNVDSLWHFSFKEYLKIFTSFNSIEMFGDLNKSPTGMSAIASVSIVLLLVNKQIKYRKYLFAVVILVLLFMLVPFGSFLLNGFGYHSNRCGYLFSFALAAVTVFLLPYIISPEAGKSKRNAAALAAYTCILLTAILINPDKTNNMIVGFWFMLAFIIVLLLPVGTQTIHFFISEKVKTNGIIVLLTINLTVNAYLFKELPFISDGLTAEYLYDVINISKFIEDDSFYREYNYTMSSFYQMTNLAMLNRYYGTVGYWSFLNPNFQDFSVKLENSQQRFREWYIMGFDDRTALYSLSALKYYITNNENPPFGYNLFGKINNPELTQTWFIYKNEYVLPLGYTYKNVVSASVYDKLDPLDKQTLLMLAAVLPDEYNSLGGADISSMLNKVKIPYTINKIKYIICSKDVFTIVEADGFETDDDYITNAPAMTINFEGLRNSEVYIRIAGIEKASRKDYSLIEIENDNIKKEIILNLANADHLIRNDGRIVNLGYSETGKSYADFTFYLMENYTINNIEVYCLPMDDYPAWIEALREDVLENIVISTNKVIGDISLEEEKVLILSIPYSKGWSCKVNGEERILLKANHMFMGLPLDAGYHSIELTYRTPGLLEGVMVSLVGGLMFVGISVFNKRKD